MLLKQTFYENRSIKFYTKCVHTELLVHHTLHSSHQCRNWGPEFSGLCLFVTVAVTPQVAVILQMVPDKERQRSKASACV